MPIKDFIGGDISSVDADDLNTYLIQSHHLIKPSDESVSNTTTPQNDNHLALQVASRTNYWVICQIIYTGATGGDLKIGFSGPTGSTFSWCSDALAAGATTTTDIVSRSRQELFDTPQAGSVAGADAIACVKGVLRVGTFGGTFRFRWAQGTSSGTSTTVRAGSTFMIRRLIL